MFFWPFSGSLVGFVVPVLFLLFGVRILRRFIRGSRRSWDSTFEEYERPSVPYDDYTAETHYTAPVAPEESSETVIFRLADQLKGRLTVSDIVINTKYGLKEAERMIDGMVDGVHVSMEVTDSGSVIYEFPEIIARYEREQGSS